MGLLVCYKPYVVTEDTRVTPSSRNVSQDMGVAAPEETLTKAQIAANICRVIRQRGLSQRQAAEILGVDQPKVSALMRGRLEGFSCDRLLRFLNALGRDIEVIIRPADERANGAAERAQRTYDTQILLGDDVLSGLVTHRLWHG